MKNVHIGWAPVGMTKIKVGGGKKIQLNKSRITGIMGTEFQLIIVSPYEGIPVWRSSNEEIAKVDQNGNVIFLKEGSAVITVLVDNLSGKCNVSVVLSKEQQFIKDLEAGNVVLSDSITKTAVISNNTEIKLNGNTLTGEVFTEMNGEMFEGGTDSYAIWAKEGSVVEIAGDGEVRSQSAKYSMAVWAQGGTVIINGGKYYNEGEGSDLIYASAGGKVYIYDGEFHANEMQEGVPGTANKHSALNVKDSDYKSGISEIVVYGGKFYGFNPENNLSEGPGTNFVAEGYQAIEVEPNVWEVQKIKSQLDESKIYYGTIQSPTFTSYSELTEQEVVRAINEGTLVAGNLAKFETLINVKTEGDAVVILVPSKNYTVYKDNGAGTKVVFDETASGASVDANGEIKLGDFYVFGEMMFVATGNLKIYVE